MSERLPNVLVIMTDQQRGDTVNKGACHTPNLDRLAREGVKFTKAYTTNAVCSPARASLMSGMYPSQHGMIDCTHNIAPYRGGLRSDVPLWPQKLAEAGYAGGYFGKWHVERGNSPQSYGFDHFINKRSPQYRAYREKLGLGDPVYSWQHFIRHKGYRDRLLCGVYDEPVEATEPYFLYSQAIAFIREQTAKGQPWMTMISTTQPHEPYSTLQSYYERYANDDLLPASRQSDLSQKPGLMKRLRSVFDSLSEEDARKAKACYYGLCTQIDDQVGRLLEALEETGQSDRTIIVYLSDHGDMMGDHGLFTKGITPYEGVYNVPMIVRGPGIHHPGRVSTAKVSLVDVASTLTEWAIREPFAYTAGRSLLPLLRGEEQDASRNEAFAEFHGQRYGYTQRIFWRDEMKYIFNTFDQDELYNLEQDPDELHNLIHDERYANTLEEMAAGMWSKIRETGEKWILEANYYTMRFAPVGPDYMTEADGEVQEDVD